MAMPTIMADHDVEGHLRVLIRIWSSPAWAGLWSELKCDFESFESLGLELNTPDRVVWQTCQDRGIVLLTGNRNAIGNDSLHVTIQQESKADSLPVFTISNPTRLMNDSEYAGRVANRIYDFLRVLDRLRGSGRMYIP
jgi:hypothetical protein